MTALVTLRSFAIAGTTAFLAACAVGPDYRAPEAPAAGAYTERPQPERTEAAAVRGGEAQRFEAGAEISADWWKLFGSAALDELIRTALAGHPTLEAAQAALLQAQENLNAQYAVLYPSVDASLGAKRQRITGATFGNPSIPTNVFNLYNASVNVSYAIDVAGGARRELEALQAGIEFQRFQLEAAYLSLTSNIATTAFREASLREQVRATREIVEAQDRQLQLVEKQFALGAVARSDVLGQRAQLAQTRANLTPVEKALAHTRNQLAVPIGKFPGEPMPPELDLGAFQLPQALPVSLPSDLVRQRPDIRTAEAILHQTNARIGVAQALMFPQLTIGGGYGVGATNSEFLFDRSSLLWNIGANLLQPIFHAGQLQARKRGAIAAYYQAFAQYQQTVLGAFQNVADVLFALEFDAIALKAQGDAEAAARESLEMTIKQLQFGSASYLALFNAQRQYEQAKIGLVQAQAARYADTAALFQALGGGWWSRGEQDPARPRLAN